MINIPAIINTDNMVFIIFSFNDLKIYKPSLTIEDGVYIMADGDNIIKVNMKHKNRLISENIEYFLKMHFLLLISENIMNNKAHIIKKHNPILTRISSHTFLNIIKAISIAHKKVLYNTTKYFTYQSFIY